MKRNSAEYVLCAKLTKRTLSYAVTLPHGRMIVPAEFWATHLTPRGVIINLLDNGGLDTDEPKTEDSPYHA